jgi:uncharacterized protein (TIGR02598 family)
MNRRDNDGYSLVEITLALLVAAMGIMAVFALFPDGLNASRRAVDASQLSAFADHVFAALEMDLETLDWDAFEAQRNLYKPAGMVKTTGNEITVNDSAPREYYWQPLNFGNVGAFDGSSENAIDSYRYAYFTYLLEIDVVPGMLGDSLKYARLKVWPGKQAAAVQANPDKGGYTLFYREFRQVF